MLKSAAPFGEQGGYMKPGEMVVITFSHEPRKMIACGRVAMIDPENMRISVMLETTNSHFGNRYDVTFDEYDGGEEKEYFLHIEFAGSHRIQERPTYRVGGWDNQEKTTDYSLQGLLF